VTLNVQLGAQVKGSDDSNLGKVKLVVADPDNKQVTHLVIEKGAFGTTERVADRSLVTKISDDGKTVWLSINQSGFDELPDFVEREYTVSAPYNPMVPPNPGTSVMQMSPGVSVTTPVSAGGFFDPVPEPTVSPVDSFGEAFEEHLNVPENSLLIKEGAEVQANDGKLGKIKRVNLDPATGKIASFVVEEGLFFHREQTIPVEMVEDVTEDTVTVKGSKDMFNNPVYGRQDSSGEYHEDVR
jgi:uncharacterized protein YrrD